VAPVPGEGPTWLQALATLPDDSGAERLVASYGKVHGLVTIYRRGA